MATSHFALVLPGAVARGAFEAGVITALVDRNVKIDRIIATSSGALNGIAYAAAIRSGTEREMVDALTTSWLKNGAWSRSLSLNVWNLLRKRGLSDQAGLLSMMRDLIKPCRSAIKREVELTVVVSPLDGVVSKIGSTPATTYEKHLRFTGEDFDSEERLEAMFQVVSAACAFPGLFEPVNLPGLGPCIDGGAVNNAPIGGALRENDVNHVLIAIPFPAVMEECPDQGGLLYINHLAEVLINERLFRDLSSAETLNDQVRRIEALAKTGVLTAEQASAVKEALDIREVQITQIRPEKRLKQSAFSGFFHEEDRKALIEEGHRAASTILDRLPAAP